MENRKYFPFNFPEIRKKLNERKVKKQKLIKNISFTQLDNHEFKKKFTTIS